MTLPVTVTFGKVIESDDVNPTIKGLNGEAATTFLITGATEVRGAALSLNSTSGLSITSPLGLQGGTTYSMLGLKEGTSAIAAATFQPTINIRSHIRPNGTAGLTGATVSIGVTRYGSNSAGDGNMYAHAGLIVVCDTNSTAAPFSGSTDNVAGWFEALTHKNGDNRGGTANSIARSYAIHARAANFYADASSPTTGGQAIGAEIKVVNNTGYTAVLPDAANIWNRNYGLQIVSNIDEDGGSSGSLYNSAGINISTAGVYQAAFRIGMYIVQNSVKDIIIDAYQASWNGAVVPFARLANNSHVLARNAANGADVYLWRLGTGDTHDIFFGRSAGTTDQNIQFITQAGSTNLSITPAGILNFIAGNVTAVAAGATTPTLTAIATATSGMPSVGANTHWLKVQRAGTALVVPAWTMTA